MLAVVSSWAGWFVWPGWKPCRQVFSQRIEKKKNSACDELKSGGSRVGFGGRGVKL